MSEGQMNSYLLSYRHRFKNRLEKFRRTGGFIENMTAERLESLKTQALESGAPLCPKCGKPMLRCMQKNPMNLEHLGNLEHLENLDK